MGVKVRKKSGSNGWWIFISHKNQRRTIKVGPRRRTAETIAERIRERIILGEFDLKPNRKLPDIDYQIFSELKDINMALKKLRATTAKAKKEEA